MKFVISRLGYGRGGNHKGIIAKHPRGAILVYAHHKERIACKHEFRSIGSHFYRLFLHTKRNNRCLVDKMINALQVSTRDKDILIDCSAHELTSANRLVRRFFSLKLP
jgi:hypothetical protein